MMMSSDAAADDIVGKVRAMYRIPSTTLVDPRHIAPLIESFIEVDELSGDATSFETFVVCCPATYAPPAQKRIFARTTARFVAARLGYPPDDEAMLARVQLQLFGVRGLQLVKASSCASRVDRAG